MDLKEYSALRKKYYTLVPTRYTDNKSFNELWSKLTCECCDITEKFLQNMTLSDRHKNLTYYYITGVIFAKCYKFLIHKIPIFFIRLILKEMTINFLRYCKKPKNFDIYNRKTQEQLKILITTTIENSFYLKLALILKNRSFKYLKSEVSSFFLNIQIEVNDETLLDGKFYKSLWKMKRKIRKKLGEDFPAIIIKRNKKLPKNDIVMKFRNIKYIMTFMDPDLDAEEKIGYLRNGIENVYFHYIQDAYSQESVIFYCEDYMCSNLFYVLRKISLNDLKYIICKLLQKRISIKKFDFIIDTLNELTEKERNPDILAEKLILKIISKNSKQ